MKEITTTILFNLIPSASCCWYASSKTFLGFKELLQKKDNSLYLNSIFVLRHKMAFCYVLSKIMIKNMIKKREKENAQIKMEKSNSARASRAPEPFCLLFLFHVQAFLTSIFMIFIFQMFGRFLGF